MKKKHGVFGFLVKTAVAAAAVGGIAYVVKDALDKKALEDDFDDDFDDDFEDFDDDLEEDFTSEREYVNITLPPSDEESSEAAAAESKPAVEADPATETDAKEEPAAEEEK